MIFSNKVYKLTSGQNPTLFADDKFKMNLFLFREKLYQSHIELSSITKCYSKVKSFDFEYIEQLNKNFFLGGSNGIITIFDNNESY